MRTQYNKFKSKFNDKFIRLKKNLDKDLFRKYALSYVMIAVFSIIAFMPVYIIVCGQIRDSVAESNIALLRQTADIMDVRLEEVNDFVNQLYLDSDIRSYARADLTEDESRLKRWSLPSKISRQMATTKIIYDAMIYYKKEDVIVTGNSSYPLQDFYNNSYQYGDLGLDQWKEKFLRSYKAGKYFSHEYINASNYSENIITYAVSFPLNTSQGVYDSVVIIHIKEDEIKKLLSLVNLYHDGYLYVTDSEGNLITDSTGTGNTEIKVLDTNSNNATYQKHINGQKMVVMSVKSDINNWNYTAVIPSRDMFMSIIIINLIMVGVIILILIAVFMLSVFFARINIRPIKDIGKVIDKFLDRDSDLVEPEYIKKSLNTIINDYNEVKDEIESQRSFVSNTFLINLFEGKYNETSEIEQIQKNIQIDIISLSYVVAKIRINVNMDEEDINIVKAMLKIEFRKSAQSVKINIQEVSEHTIAVLLGFYEISESYCERVSNYILKCVEDSISDKRGYTLSMAVDGVVHDLMDISKCYENSSETLDYMVRGDLKGVMWNKSMPKQWNNFKYSIDFETKLINLALMGNYEGIEKMLDNFYRENIDGKLLSALELKQILYSLRGTAYRVIEKTNKGVDFENVRLKLSKTVKLSELLNILKELYSNVCSEISKSKSKYVENTVKEIVRYIEKDFGNKDLSLVFLSQKFKISEKYLSATFKNVTGETVSNYIERVRINEACKLLIKEDLQVGDISERTGYVSDGSFRRAFKRVKGISPTEYRKGVL